MLDIIVLLAMVFNLAVMFLFITRGFPCAFTPNAEPLYWDHSQLYMPEKEESSIFMQP